MTFRGYASRAIVPGAVFLCLTTGFAAAAPYTGTGGGPETTVNAPYRSSTGQTVPPGREAAPDADPRERTHRQKSLDRVLDSICEACGAGSR